tara:strand:- start:10 stop:261 length:252 start_codon:yes stop_codon:yes gene_type:complete
LFFANADKASGDKTNVSSFIIIYMYKQKKSIRLQKMKQPIYWIKRKILLITTAFMLGMSNSLNNEDTSVFDSQYTIEQRDKKD